MRTKQTNCNLIYSIRWKQYTNNTTVTGENYNDLVPTVGKNALGLNYYLVIILINMFCIVPMLILRFQDSYVRFIDKRDSIQKETSTNCCIASFILLDTDCSETLEKREVGNLFQILGINHNISDDSDINKTNQLSLTEYTELMLKHPVDKAKSKLNVFVNQFQAYLECKIYCNPMWNIFTLLFAVVPAVLCVAFYELANMPNNTLNTILVLTYCWHILDIVLKIYAFGIPEHTKAWQLWNYKFFHLDKCRNSPFVEWCLYSQNRIGIDKYGYLSLIYLSRRDIKFCTLYLKGGKNNNQNNNQNNNNNNNKDNYKHIIAKYGDETIWDRECETITNRFDFVIMFTSFIWICVAYANGDSSNFIEFVATSSSARFWLVMPICRIFTLLDRIKFISYTLISVVLELYHILLFATLFIIIWARIGVTLFYEKTDVVLAESFDTEVIASFDSLGDGVKSLIQVMIGDSWGDILYVNILATGSSYVFYFVIFVLVITLFIVNIIVALILKGVDYIQNQVRMRNISGSN